MSRDKGQGELRCSDDARIFCCETDGSFCLGPASNFAPRHQRILCTGARLLKFGPVGLPSFIALASGSQDCLLPKVIASLGARKARVSVKSQSPKPHGASKRQAVFSSCPQTVTGLAVKLCCAGFGLRFATRQNWCAMGS